MKTWFILALILGGLSAAPLAQAQQPAFDAQKAAPFFLGAHVFQSHYEVFFPTTPNSTTAGPWQLTGGYNVSPRLAVQIGYAYRHELYQSDPAYTGTTLTGHFVSGSSYSERWTHCLPLEARYAVLFLGRRFQVDALLGLTAVQLRTLVRGENRVDGQVVSRFEQAMKATQGYASGGAGLRYAFGKHVEGVFDWTYSRNFHPASADVHLETVGNKWGLTRTLSLGLRYRFAVHKRAAPSTAR